MPTADLATLRALRDRLGAAKEGNRDLDREIHAVFMLPPNAVIHNGMLWNSYSSSIDAALALVKRVLPGWIWCARNWEDGRHLASLHPPGTKPNEGGPVWMVYAPSAPLAILSALLSALIAQQEAASHG